MQCHPEQSEETTFDEVNLVYIHVGVSEMLHFVQHDKSFFLDSLRIDYN